MTVKEDMEKRIKFYESDPTNFGYKILAAGIKSAMERMTKEELEMEIIE